MEKYYKKIIYVFGSIFYIILSLFIKRKSNCIAFGSWTGKYYIDNSRYLAEYIMKNHNEYTVYWVGDKELRSEIQEKSPKLVFLEKDTICANLKLLKCKYFFFSQVYTVDISNYNVIFRAVTCYLHHGTPVKCLRDARHIDSKEKSARQKIELIINKITGKISNYSYFPVSSRRHGEVYTAEMKNLGYVPEKMIPSGTPRNDMLVNYQIKFSHDRKTYYAQRLLFDKNAKIIMYLPTYRRKGNNIFSFANLNEKDLSTLLKILDKYNIYLIEKSHFAELVEYDKPNLNRIRFAEKDVNVQEMLLFTDYLISDYSGAFLDFILMDRPVIHFAYDYEYYRDMDSGLHYEIEDFSAGEVVYDFANLCIAIEKLLKGEDVYSDKRHAVRNDYMEYEQGHASEIIFNTVVKNGKMTI